MNCPNCKNPFAFESGGKFNCDTCGWFENVGDPNPEWHTCEAPEPEMPPEPELPREPDLPKEPDPPDPGPGNEPEPQVREFLWGKVTFTTGVEQCED